MTPPRSAARPPVMFLVRLCSDADFQELHTLVAQLSVDAVLVEDQAALERALRAHDPTRGVLVMLVEDTSPERPGSAHEPSIRMLDLLIAVARTRMPRPAGSAGARPATHVCALNVRRPDWRERLLKQILSMHATRAKALDQN